ncbi:hypothetical protein BDR22DRAFT_643734 [Usnea florida]
MAPPSKRRCLSGSSYTEIDLHARRAQNDCRLKSIFESIFDKYGKDFNGIGDEIDMETGEIVVNNGHLLGMANERDAGDGQYSCEELGESNDDEDETAVEQSEIDVDSLMGDVPIESHLHQLGEKVRLVTSMPSDDEEDELASSEVERTSQRRERLAAPENCWLFNDKTAFADKPALEAAWRAPPLPNRSFMKAEGEKIRMNNANSMRDHSDDEQAGISLWASNVKRRPRRIRESTDSKIVESRSLSSGLDDSGSAARKQKQKWTQEEKERLIQLKTSTNLSYTAMESYFPERSSTSIGSYWNYMINRIASANPKPHSPTASECMIPLPSLSPGKTRASSDETRPEHKHHHSVFPTDRKSQLTEQQSKGEIQEMGNSVRISSKPVEQSGHHDMTPGFQSSDDHGTLNGYAGHESSLVSTGIGAHTANTTGESFSSTSDSEVEKFPMDESLDDANEHFDRTGHVIGREHNRSAKSPLYTDQERNRRIKCAEMPDVSTRRTSDSGPRTDGGHQTAEPVHQAISQDSRVDIEQSSRLSQSLEIEDGKRLDLYCEGFDLSETQSRATVTMNAANPLQRPETTECVLQKQKSISTTIGGIVQQNPSLAVTTERTELSSINSAQPPGYGMEIASHATDVEMIRTNLPERQIVQVVIPLAATSDAKKKAGGIKQTPLSPVSIRSPSAHMETASHALSREFAAAVEDVPTALSPILPIHETLVIRTPTRSPSVAAAESQYAVSAAFVLGDGRPSLGPEIADSQPLSTTPAVATRLRASGSEASNPIILDIESQSSSVTPGAATPTGNQARQPTKTINRNLDSQPLRVTPGIASARRTLVEEALESDIVESGSPSLGKTLVMTRSPVKKVKKQTISDRFSSTWTAFNDDSEDELSYL